MRAKEIISDLTFYDSIKNLRKRLREMLLEFLTNDEIDNRQDCYSSYIVIDQLLKQIGKYERKRLKK